LSAKNAITGLLAQAGITVDGSEPWDMAVHDDRFYGRLLADSALGLGESYMAGWWDVPDLYEFFRRMVRWRMTAAPKPNSELIMAALKAKLFNRQTIAQTQQLANAHYNLSNDMFRAMLGPTMAYSCGYWKEADNLDDAQNAKLDLVCRKLGLKAGDRVLEIGCGWGSFARFAAENYGCHVTGITIAAEQAHLARELCAGLPVEIIESDYRLFDNYGKDGAFDAVVSIGMAEAVGERNYRIYMETAERALKPGGMFLLHTIGVQKPGKITRTSWFEKYIFPGGQHPTIAGLSAASEGLFVMEDLHNIGQDYAPTLLAWCEKFERYWEGTDPATAVENYGGSPDVFYRMWRYYLLSSAATFSVRNHSLWQMVLAKGGAEGGYTTVR
jgi:cyclopropane-fatty-acyl-phospholipid synthase